MYRTKPKRPSWKALTSLAIAAVVVVGGSVMIEVPFSQSAPPGAAPMPPDATVSPPTIPVPESRDPVDEPAPGDPPNDRASRRELGPPGGLAGVAGVTEADGLLPEGTTVFDSDYPGIANLDTDLLKALREAASDSGLDFPVSSGWRSAKYQQQLLDQAVALYGSEAEAARWVAPADKSLHVSGDAVDLDGPKSKAWLAEHGAGYGLCLVYENEPWHFELRREAPRQGCPAMYTDAAHDPRLQ
jgi:hypothetical protein